MPRLRFLRPLTRLGLEKMRNLSPNMVLYWTFLLPSSVCLAFTCFNQCFLKCKVSGDYSKNFRSEGDLKILGKWLKGRLENAGVLQVGDPVTADTLRNYGRRAFTLSKTRLPGIWYLDFGVKR